MQLLDKNYIIANTQEKKYTLEIFESIDSTNTYLRKMSAAKYPRFCLAEQQTLGQGRFGRSWYSPFGQNIYLSALYLCPKNGYALAGLSLIIALAIIKVLQKYLPANKIKAKWPNDVIVTNKKIAGAIVESKSIAPELSSVIIGIGLNVNMVTTSIDSWTSIHSIRKNYVNRNEVCVLLINFLLEYLKRFIASGVANFIQEWHKVDYLLAKKITINNANINYTGIAKGIDEFGRLLIELSDGIIKPFVSGDTTIGS